MHDSRHTAVIDTLLGWFAVEGRDWPWRATRDRWRILVSEICLQQTQVQRAAPFIDRILDRFPTSDVLASAPLPELLELWQGLGYPRRARNLQLAARMIAENGWPDDYQALPGVGPYTAAALRCFADEEAIVPPDINTRRVMARVFPGGAPSATDTPKLRDEAWAWGQAIMDLGQRVCRARAQCDVCPLRELCPSAGTEEVIASPRQSKFAGSMRQRRGVLLAAVLDELQVAVERDSDAASSLVADGLVKASDDGEWLYPPHDA